MPTQENEVKNPVTGTENQAEETKTFTQEELEQILKERIKRAQDNAVKKTEDEVAERLKERTTELEAKETEITLRENLLECKAYLADKNYPSDLLDLFDTSNSADFIKTVDRLASIEWKKPEKPPLAPLKSTEKVKQDDLAIAFKKTGRDPKFKNY